MNWKDDLNTLGQAQPHIEEKIPHDYLPDIQIFFKSVVAQFLAEVQKNFTVLDYTIIVDDQMGDRHNKYQSLYVKRKDLRLMTYQVCVNVESGLVRAMFFYDVKNGNRTDSKSIKHSFDVPVNAVKIEDLANNFIAVYHKHRAGWEIG